MLNINTGYITAAALVLGILGGWYFTQDVLNARHQSELDKIAATSQKAQADLNVKITNLERGMASISTEAETKYVTKQKELDVANSKYSDLVQRGFRLRDTASTTGSSETGPAVTGTTTVTNGTGTGELSRDATERLWSLATRADRVAEKLAGCQAYSTELKSYINTQVSDWNKQWSNQ